MDQKTVKLLKIIGAGAAALAAAAPLAPFSVATLPDGTKEIKALLYKIVKWDRVFSWEKSDPSDDVAKAGVFAPVKVYCYPKNRLSVDELFAWELKRGNVRATYETEIGTAESQPRPFSDFEKEWVREFAGTIPQEKIDQHVISYGNYIWHVFSWELLPREAYREGDAARAAYDAEDHTGAVFFEPFADEEDGPRDENDASAAALDRRIEIYVVAADRSWSYIKTHEGDGCGPYFIKKEAGK